MIELSAPAKVNLCLRVKSRRPDGYHEIDTLFQKLELADRLHLELSGRRIRLRCPGGEVPANEDNLAYRAAALFFSEYPVDAGVEITLEKKIPVAAGLGGGSSDAAAVLRGLNHLLEAGLSEDRLLAMGARLGADVPFFVSSCSTARATGIGECLSSIRPLVDCWFVLVNPGYPLSTRWVYENLALTSTDNPYILARGRRAASCQAADPAVPAGFVNDLEPVAFRKYPELIEIKRKLMEDGASLALLSGSGPTVFGLFHERKSADRSRAAFARDPGKIIFLTRPLAAGHYT